MADVPTEPYVGRDIAGYRIEARIGRGGMGVVYRAQQLRLSRQVALKIIAPDLAQTAGFRERFEREARIAASLHHPNVVAVFDAGEDEGLLWLAMQLVVGPDLATVLANESRLTLERTVDVVEQIAAALDAAHATGLVHRDVKPGNVLIAGRRAYLSDFGLTKLDAGSDAMLTRAGDMVGSLHYCPPEQIQGRALDARADVYALGALLYHCLAGSVPFARDSGVAVMYAQLNEPVPRLTLTRPDLPSGLDAVIARAMEKLPDRRFASCGDLAASVRAAVAEAGPVIERPPPAPRPIAPDGDDEDQSTFAGRRVAADGDRSAIGTVVAEAPPPRAGGPARVLLAGLSGGTTALMRVALGERVDVHEAEGAGAAVAAARAERPDVVVLDWNAAAGGGREALRGLRSDTATRGTKVLLLVDWANADRGEVAATGADASVGVPFSALQLQVQFRKLLGRDALAG